jgi:outer membrane protein assembly factor BamB
LEAHRAQQAQQVPVTPVAASLPVESAPAAATLPASSGPAASGPAAPEVKPTIPTWNDYWTDFLGPNRLGRYDQMPILTDWPAAGLDKVWKQPIGGGYASFTIAAGRAYTIEQRRKNEAITAYDVLTGRELWAYAYPAAFDEVLGGPGPRATPVYHEGLLYSMGATGELVCLSASTGKVKWSKNILADNDAQNIHWAMSASPLIVDDKVIVLPGGTSGKSVVAYDKLTGKRIWSSMNDRAGYASPVLATLAGERQIVVFTGEHAAGLTVDGRVLWTFPWSTMNDINCVRPLIVGENSVMISSSYGVGAALIEIVKGPEGYTTRTVWKNNQMKNKFSHSVLRDGFIYGLDDAILACMDAKTGDLKWKGGRYGFGQLLLAGDHLVVITEDGDLVLVEATADGHHEKARFSALSGKTWNVPAIDHGLLLVRNTTEMACFRIGKK